MSSTAAFLGSLSTDFTAVVYTLFSIDNRMSHRRHRCTKLMSANHVFRIRDDIPFGIRLIGEMQLPR